MAVGSSRTDGNLHVTGTLTAEHMVLSSGAVTDDSVLTGANVAATKLEHQHVITHALTAHAADAAAAREVIHVVWGATATVIGFAAGSTVAATSTGTATVTLKKNGSTILSGSIVLDSANTAFILEAAPGFTSTALVAGDVLEAEITGVSGSTVPKGVFVRLVVRERAD
jgi:hypothetical protein